MRWREPTLPEAFRAAFCLAVAMLVTGCASVPPDATGSAPPWQTPAEELRQQSLFRLSYRGPDGNVSLKLVLRLENESSYRLAAADLFGRPLWTLIVNGSRALWVDEREERWCALGSAVRLPDLGLPSLPLRAVPALLLGRVPAQPADRSASARDFRDAENRRWTVTGSGGETLSWTYWEGDRPALWFGVQGGEMVLSSARREAQLRWRRTLREPLTEAVPPTQAPAGFAQGGCDEPRLP